MGCDKTSDCVEVPHHQHHAGGHPLERFKHSVMELLQNLSDLLLFLSWKRSEHFPIESFATELLCEVKLILSAWCRRDEPLAHRHGEHPVVLNIESLTAGPHLSVILLHNPHPQAGKSLPHIVADLLVQAMVEQHHLALQVARGRPDQDVAWVGVGVDEAGVEELVGEDV